MPKMHKMFEKQKSPVDYTEELLREIIRPGKWLVMYDPRELPKLKLLPDIMEVDQAGQKEINLSMEVKRTPRQVIKETRRMMWRQAPDAVLGVFDAEEKAQALRCYRDMYDLFMEYQGQISDLMNRRRLAMKENAFSWRAMFGTVA